MTSTKNPKQTNCLVLNYKISQVFREFEQLSSSFGWQVMAYSPNDQGSLSWDFNLYPIFGF